MSNSRTICGFLIASAAAAQSLIDLGKQARNPDLSALPHTRPIQVGANLPASCSIGEMFFSSVPVDGNSVFACVTTDDWSPVASGGLGSCTVSSNNLSCPGDLNSGTGATAGKISFYETAANGGHSIAVSVPDAIVAPYTLMLPGSGPQVGQSLAFAQPDSSGVALGSWVTLGPAGSSSATGQFSLHGTSDPSGNSISIAVPATIPTSYTLQLPDSPPLSGQTLAFGAPDSNHLSLAFWQTGGGSSSGGSNVYEGIYAGLPSGCSDGSMYLFTDSLYPFARCSAGAWHHFFDGHSIVPPTALALSNLVVSSHATVSGTHGYEQIAAPAGSSIALRSWAAPTSTGYTKYVVLRAPMFLDQANYRLWHVGFADASGKSHVLTCGVGAASFSGYWCRITRLTNTGGYAGQDSAIGTIPYISGTVIVALQDDGSNLHFAVSSDGSSFFEIGSVARNAYLTSPSRLAYGFENSATGQNLALDFLGVY